MEASELRPGLRLCHRAGWLPSRSSDVALARLLEEVSWKAERITVFGRRHAMPRLVCWMADPGCGYRYSGLENVIEPWSAAVAELRELVSAACGCAYNSVLLNLYRDGRDSMGWHSDDEPELDAQAPIASVSLGATRTLRFRPRRSGPEGLQIELAHGDLLVMEAPTQEAWQHALPRRLRVQAPRVNLTFRVVAGRARGDRS